MRARRAPACSKARGLDACKFSPKPTPLPAWMIDANGTLPTDCVIFDISLAGARLSLLTLDPVPEIVYVLGQTRHVAYEAKVAWRSPYAAGPALNKSINSTMDCPRSWKRFSNRNPTNLLTSGKRCGTCWRAAKTEKRGLLAQAPIRC
jgi:hypothetical protein